MDSLLNSSVFPSQSWWSREKREANSFNRGPAPDFASCASMEILTGAGAESKSLTSISKEGRRSSVCPFFAGIRGLPLCCAGAASSFLGICGGSFACVPVGGAPGTAALLGWAPAGLGAMRGGRGGGPGCLLKKESISSISAPAKKGESGSGFFIARFGSGGGGGRATLEDWEEGIGGGEGGFGRVPALGLLPFGRGAWACLITRGGGGGGGTLFTGPSLVPELI